MSENALFPKKTKILVVDDLDAMRQAVTSVLRDLEYIDITEAKEGEQAWTLIEEAIQNGSPFELIFSDLHMEPVGGLQLLERLRENEATKNVPFLMLTTERELKEVLRAARLNANAYIIKPFQTGMFTEKLAEVYEQVEKKQAA